MGMTKKDLDSVVGCIRIRHTNGRVTHWAFDLSDEYEKARDLLTERAGVGVTFDAQPGLIKDYAIKSEGLNDADEVAFCLSNRGELRGESPSPGM
ncbi:hypothetical protein ACEUZ9_000926 [Paracoccus litorisediminis]|uniref:hypothetical protein n=1 Tax=Paracoccus litorisediminis TaxID=2006130 RepID=UPI003733842E